MEDDKKSSKFHALNALKIFTLRIEDNIIRSCWPASSASIQILNLGNLCMEEEIELFRKRKTTH